MPSHVSAGQVITVLVVALLVVLVVSAAAAWWKSRAGKGRRGGVVYSRLGVAVHLPGEGPSLEEWATWPPEWQEAWDNAVLDQVDIAEADAEEAARFLADRARTNSLYHP